MSNDPFATPAAPGGGIKYDDIKGSLILVKVVSLEEKVKTAYGENDAVRADVRVLDGPQGGEKYLDTLIFPRLLVGQLKGSVGGMVLGRLGQGQAKTGQSPPWLLLDPTDQDKDVARRFLSSQFSSPATTAPAAEPVAAGVAPSGDVPF